MKVLKDLIVPSAKIFFAKSFSGKILAVSILAAFILGVILF